MRFRQHLVITKINTLQSHLVFSCKRFVATKELSLTKIETDGVTDRRARIQATPVQTVGGRGCITSTPKTTDFGEKRHFWPKYERSSCMPWRKNGERPYPEPRKVAFWDPGFGAVSVVSAGIQTWNTLYTTCVVMFY